MDIYAARIDELIKKGENPSFRSRSERWKNGTHVTRLVERAKTSFGPGSRDIKERRSRGKGRARDRWSLLVACRSPSTLDAVYSSSTHSSLGSAGPLALDGKH